jgi:hypothetical protein
VEEEHVNALSAIGNMQQVDVVGSLMRGQQARSMQEEMQNQNALRAAMQEYGGAAMQGDQNALAQIAQYDPAYAMDLTRQQHGMANDDRRLGLAERQASHSMANDDRRIAMAQQEAAMRAQEYAATADARALEREAAEVSRLAAAAQTAYAQGPEAWERYNDTIEGYENVPFEDAPMVIAKFTGTVQGLAEPIKLGASDRLVTPGGQTIVDAAPPDLSAAELQVQRLMETGLTRTEAIAIADGRHTTSVDPLTREATVLDRHTGQTVGGQQPPAQTLPPIASTGEIGPTANNAREAFGASGFGQNIANTAADVTGFQQPYPETGQAVADFTLLRERVLADLSDAYGRQPPSWLLQEIRKNIPDPASLRQGPDGAVQQLTAIENYLTEEIESAQRMLDQRLSPTARQEAEARFMGVGTALDRIKKAKERLAPSSSGGDDIDAIADRWAQ